MSDGTRWLDPPAAGTDGREPPERAGPGADAGAPGGAAGTGEDGRAASWASLDERPDARASAALRVVALAAMVPFLGAVAYAVSGDQVVAGAVVAALLGGVAVGLLADLDRYFDQISGVALAIGVPVALLGLAAIAERITSTFLLLLMVLAAFLWGLDWSRVKRLRTQSFLLVLPVWFGFFAEDPALTLAGAALALVVLASMVLASADEVRALPRVSTSSQAPPARTSRATDLAVAATAAVLAGLFAFLLLGDRSLAPSTDEIADRLPFDSSSPADPSEGSGASGGSSSGGASGEGGTFFPPDGSAGGGEPFVVPEGGSASGGGGALDAPGGEGEASGGSPQGEGPGFGAGGGSGVESGGVDPFTGEPLEPTSPDDESPVPEIRPELVVGVLLAVIAAALLVWWWRSRPRPARADLVWAESLARRLAREGARRGRPRAPAESLLVYTTELAADPLPDDRLAVVGAVLSATLFGDAEPTAEEQAWAEAVVEEVLAAHPPPSLATTTRRRLTPTR